MTRKPSAADSGPTSVASDPASLEQDRAAYALLADVVDLSPEAQEEALLRADQAVAERVRSLLAGPEVDEADWASPVISAAADPIPEQIGPYRILEPLGEGGMGRVYLAQQDEPVRRQVALKVLGVSLGSGEARARFEAERHAMGRLDHPNIGHLLDAGRTEDDLPYFAMELIQGSPITEYADAKTLGIEARIRLMVDVCRAVEHAHRKFLLHRDIKPSNVLVAEVDKPTPKLIDFGIAKGLDQKLIEKTLATGNRLLGTPEYMSPEALGLGGDLDTRSDVFSLGVLLYELLAGVRPWSLPGGGPMQRLGERMHQEPKRPSTEISQIDGEKRTELALLRQLQPMEHRARLRGDLDRIVMKAMAHNPDERYSSAADLGDDLERFLRDEPVSARRPTNLYLLRKLVRRNRPASVAVLVAVVSMLLGIFSTGLALTRARQAEQQALTEAAAATAARDESEEVVRFMTRAFRGSSVNAPGQSTAPSERSARDILESGVAEIDRELADRPLIQARLKTTIGDVYRQLGLLHEAEAQATEAAAIYRRFEAEDPRVPLLNLQTLVSLKLRLGEIDAAERWLQEAKATLAEIPDARRGADLRLEQAKLKLQEGRLHRDRGRFAQAETSLQQAIEDLRSLDPEGPNLPIALNTLAVNHFRQGRWQEAEKYFREVLHINEAVLEPGHTKVARASENVGAALASQGRLAEAAPLFERSLAVKRRVLGDHHPHVAESLNNLGRLRFDLGQWSEAETLHRQALAIREEVLGSEHRNTAWSLDNLARAVAAGGDLAQAMTLQLRAASIRESLPGQPALASSLEHLSHLRREQNQLAEARELMLRRLALQTTASAEDPSQNVDPALLLDLGELEQELGDLESARRRFEIALSLETEDAETQTRLDQLRERLRASRPPAD